MNYGRPELRARLAAEYVLGTLHGRARRRFERLLARDALLRTEVEQCEQALAPLTEAVSSVPPPRRVWATIQRRLGGSDAPWWRRADFWGSFGLGGAVATGVLFAVALYLGLTPSAPERYLAVINDAAGQPAWVLRTAAVDAPIEVKAITPKPLTREQAYELWYVPGGDRAPRSLGLIPTSGVAKLKLPRDVQSHMANEAVVAVSLEPAGGSPTGLPTGPVLYTGRWVPLAGTG